MDNGKGLSHRAAYLMLLLSSFFWAGVTIIVKGFMTEMPSLHFMLSRFIIAFILFYFYKGREIKVTRHTLFHGVMTGFVLFVAYELSIVSLKYTAAAKAGFFFALSVLWVPIVRTILKRRIPSRWVMISVFLSIIGLYFISGIDGVGINYGDWVAIGSSLAYTAYILYIDRYISDMDEDQMTFIILGAVAFFSLVFALPLEGFKPETIMINIIPILIVAFFSTLLTTYLQTRAQQVASPEAVGIILLGEPVFTFLMAIVILRESVTISGVFGAILLMASLVIAVLKDV